MLTKKLLVTEYTYIVIITVNKNITLHITSNFFPHNYFKEIMHLKINVIFRTHINMKKDSLHISSIKIETHVILLLFQYLNLYSTDTYNLTHFENDSNTSIYIPLIN